MLSYCCKGSSTQMCVREYVKGKVYETLFEGVCVLEA